jgi:hypothetical protein
MILHSALGGRVMSVEYVLGNFKDSNFLFFIPTTHLYDNNHFIHFDKMEMMSTYCFIMQAEVVNICILI